MRASQPRLSWITLLALFLAPAPSRAAWQPDGNPVAAAPDVQHMQAVWPDDAGGMYVVWADARTGTYDIWAQRVDARGNALWANGGIPVSMAVNNQFDPEVTTDGAGGIIVVWLDQRGPGANDLYGQRISPAGAMLWTADGAVVNDHWSHLLEHVVVADHSGGAWVLWRDFRGGSHADIYLQRMMFNGQRFYAADGSAAYTYCGQDEQLTAISDGNGGFYAAWVNSCSVVFEVLVGHVNSMGAYGYTGLPYIPPTGGHNWAPQLALHESGDLMVAWTSNRLGDEDVFAQRMRQNGITGWGSQGVVVCSTPGAQAWPRIVSDGAEGALFAWTDYRNGVIDVYCHRVGSNGYPLWTLNGERACTDPGDQYVTALLPAGDGGALVVWDDYRAGLDVYAQRMAPSGPRRWSDNGAPVSTHAYDQANAKPVRTTDGGVMMAWEDQRAGTNDIYAGRLDAEHGTWGHPEPDVVAVSDNPADQGGRVIVKWNASGRDTHGQQLITHYSVWRAADASALAAPAVAAAVAEPSGVTADSPVGLVWREAAPASGEYWELIALQQSSYAEHYSYHMATRQDSVAGNPAMHRVRVLAHTGDPFVFYESDVDSGYSVDNLAPAAPLALVAQRLTASDVRLRWKRSREADLKWYAVFRHGATGVTPVPLYFLTNATDTTIIDSAAPAGPSYYYVVAALDVHGNQGPASNEASVSGATNVGDTPSLRALTLLPVYPNPAAGPVALRVGLPAADRIAVEIYDVAGRRVRELSRGGVAGWQALDFDGRDAGGAALPSGVYFYRVRAAGAVETGRFVIQR